MTSELRESLITDLDYVNECIEEAQESLENGQGFSVVADALHRAMTIIEDTLDTITVE